MTQAAKLQSNLKSYVYLNVNRECGIFTNIRGQLEKGSQPSFHHCALKEFLTDNLQAHIHRLTVGGWVFISPCNACFSSFCPFIGLEFSGITTLSAFMARPFAPRYSRSQRPAQSQLLRDFVPSPLRHRRRRKHSLNNNLSLEVDPSPAPKKHSTSSA